MGLGPTESNAVWFAATVAALDRVGEYDGAEESIGAVLAAIDSESRFDHDEQEAAQIEDRLFGEVAQVLRDNGSADRVAQLARRLRRDQEEWGTESALGDASGTRNTSD